MRPINITYKQALTLYEAGCMDIAVHVYSDDGAVRYAIAGQWEPQYVTERHTDGWHYAIMVE